uniref:NADH-ubiquinone oxidoreductase chain 3 n=2 Tax=Tanystylum orbiculare TaxID=88027 RepID=E0XLE6_TANOR|nr:NADH dehydrogenase subunit 3 [Tanystylum orbiculare]ADB91991.1 NADH dehydrogenase subunit 3 [Tanystylum orbiculare]
MFMIMIILFSIFVLSLLIIFMSLLLSKFDFKDMEKSSAFECGMNMMNSPLIPFSLQFFLIAIIFMIFDVEVALIVPFPLIDLINYQVTSLTMILFLLILLFGILYEWLNGALEWKI